VSTFSVFFFLPNITIEWLALLLHIFDIMGSNLIQEISYPE